GEVRLKYGYIIKCDEVVKDAAGNVIELRCTADLDSKTGGVTAGRKVKATLHWVSADHAIDAEVRLYDRLFREEMPGAGDADFLGQLHPRAREVLHGCKLEPSLGRAASGTRVQFERLGYFCVDPDTAAGRPVFNRTV